MRVPLHELQMFSLLEKLIQVAHCASVLFPLPGAENLQRNAPSFQDFQQPIVEFARALGSQSVVSVCEHTLRG